MTSWPGGSSPRFRSLPRRGSICSIPSPVWAGPRRTEIFRAITPQGAEGLIGKKTRPIRAGEFSRTGPPSRIRECLIAAVTFRTSPLVGGVGVELVNPWPARAECGQAQNAGRGCLAPGRLRRLPCDKGCTDFFALRETFSAANCFHLEVNSRNHPHAAEAVENKECATLVRAREARRTSGVLFCSDPGFQFFSAYDGALAGRISTQQSHSTGNGTCPLRALATRRCNDDNSC